MRRRVTLHPEKRLPFTQETIRELRLILESQRISVSNGSEDAHRRTVPLSHSVDSLGGFLRNHSRFNPRIEAALVAAGSVLVEDALLDALVEHRSGCAVNLHQVFCVAAGDGLPKGAQRATKLRPVGAVDDGFDDGLTGALQGRNVICHGTLFFMSLPLFPSGPAKWVQASGRQLHSPRHTSCKPQVYGNSDVGSIERKVGMQIGPGGR